MNRRDFDEFREKVVLTLGYYVSRAHLGPEQAVSLMNGFGMNGDAMREEFTDKVGYLQDARQQNPEIEGVQTTLRSFYNKPRRSYEQA